MSVCRSLGPSRIFFGLLFCAQPFDTRVGRPGDSPRHFAQDFVFGRPPLLTPDERFTFSNPSASGRQHASPNRFSSMGYVSASPLLLPHAHASVWHNQNLSLRGSRLYE